MKFKKIISVLLASSLALTTVSVTFPINSLEAKGGVRSSGVRSSKPSSSRSSKPSSSATKSSKPSSSSKTSSTKSNSDSGFTRSSKGSYRSNYNSSNNEDYKQKYQSYLNNNYRSNGFFSGSSILNGLLWYTLFNSFSSHNNSVHASDKEKELVNNIKESKTPVYMLEVITDSGETKHVTVTKEQYEKIKEGDKISIKGGKLEIK